MTIQYDPNQPIYTECYEAVRRELEAMPEAEVEPIRHDIMAAIIVALGAVPNARRIESRVRAKFGAEAAGEIDRLETVARACGKAHALHLTTLHGTDVEEMAGKLTQLRSVLLLEVRALIGRKVLPASVIGELVQGTSYSGLCLDVLQLVSALRRAWPEVEAHTGVTMLELDQCEALANAFSTTLGQNEQGSAGSPTGEMRRRAYTLFVRTYSQVRRFVTFFHWEAGDADAIAPALGSSRARTKSDTEDEELLMPAPTHGQPVVRPGMPGAPPFAAA